MGGNAAAPEDDDDGNGYEEEEEEEDAHLRCGLLPARSAPPASCAATLPSPPRRLRGGGDGTGRRKRREWMRWRVWVLLFCIFYLTDMQAHIFCFN